MRLLIREGFLLIGKVVKPSFDVKKGDIVEIQFGDKVSKFEILDLPNVANKPLDEVIKLL